MLSRGFSLVTVFVLSTLITTLGITVFMLTNIDIRATYSDVNFYLAESAARTGILRAMDRIYTDEGFCANESFSGDMGNSSYEVDIIRSGRICFIRSVGKARGAKVVKTAIIQSYYGVGLYTVRGDVDAYYGGGRLSGCDTSVDPVCYVPAFIASGRIRIRGWVRPRLCSQDRGGRGIYGDPALLPEVGFHDLTPLFFNVDCFNSKQDTACEYGLNDALEETYAINWINDNKDFEIDEYGQVIVRLPEIPPNACVIRSNITSIDLRNVDSSICEDPTSDTSFLYMRYMPVRLRGTPQKPTIIFADTNLILYRVDGGEPEGENDFGAPLLNLTIYVKDTNIFLRDDIENVRIVIENGSIVGWKPGRLTIRNSIIVLGYRESDDGNTKYFRNILYLRRPRNFFMNDSAFFGASIRFRNFSRNYIRGSLVYLYANACPDACSRDSSDSSIRACRYDLGRCGWAGISSHFTHRVYFGE
ncbi:hypothetical protein JCM9492_12600 [Aquifex pyrophilus]